MKLHMTGCLQYMIITLWMIHGTQGARYVDACSMHAWRCMFCACLEMHVLGMPGDACSAHAWRCMFCTYLEDILTALHILHVLCT